MTKYFDQRQLGRGNTNKGEGQSNRRRGLQNSAHEVMPTFRAVTH
jgi:hypothetical protein